MQLATVDGDQPWICTVWFVADDDLNLYWLSYPTRRHSQEIAKHQKVAAAIAIKTAYPVIGVQVEGEAEVVSDESNVKSITDKYIAKYDTGHDFYQNFVAGSNQHQLYRLKPNMFVLFDEVNFRDQGRVERRLDRKI